MWSALTELAEQIAANVERAPGQTEKRLVLLRGFAEAHCFNPAVTDDPDLALLDLLLQQPDMLVHSLQKLWIKGMS
ncbi:MAG: hypothetical protein ACREIH_03610 [Nitrospiraceae bacterium]